MAQAPFLGSISVGAIIVRVARELDPNERRQLAAWDQANRILTKRR
jgi:hypothetical protein